jgi:hypothetical protein
MKRAAATLDPSRLGASNSTGRPRPKAGRDRTSPHQPPGLGRRSETRLLRTLPKCSKMLPPPGCSRRWIACQLIRHPGLQPVLVTAKSPAPSQPRRPGRRPLATLRRRLGIRTSALSGGVNARLGVRIAVGYSRRCRRLQPVRSGTEGDRKRTTANRVCLPPFEAEASSFGRQVDSGNRQR